MILALAGGVGGAKLADGLHAELAPGELTVVVNIADDFELHGLHISPDLDTVMYTLAGLANSETGWGVRDESWQALSMLGRYGAPDWFRLGDRDLATHILRTDMLRRGISLSAATDRLATALGVRARLAPMCDERVRTKVQTPDGELEFQEYFVQRQCRDKVLGLRFEGIEDATLGTTVRAAIEQATAVIICPSNPFVSVGPILAVPGFLDLLYARAIPVIVVSPIVAGQALKGPAAAMLGSLGHEVSPAGIAEIYRHLSPIVLIDESDRAQEAPVRRAGAEPVVAPIVMRSFGDRRALARTVLALAGRGARP